MTYWCSTESDLSTKGAGQVPIWAVDPAFTCPWFVVTCPRLTCGFVGARGQAPTDTHQHAPARTSTHQQVLTGPNRSREVTSDGTNPSGNFSSCETRSCVKPDGKALREAFHMGFWVFLVLVVDIDVRL